MKRTALTGLFLTAALLGSPVFAADDLCGANIKTLENAAASSNTNFSADSKAELQKTIEKAKDAKQANNEKECIAITTKEITALKSIGSGSQGAK
ncbi:hypothetical protein [Pseudomonas sp. DWP3-1-2]|uniref:hypothetical protein n=1 Tax=Pseudomonas sp. DWP3-1-2 TaxID=2804645 RepID=UPI003CF9C729